MEKILIETSARHVHVTREALDYLFGEDFKLTSEHTDEFIKRVENVQGLTVLEDSSVDKGGCIVETDFGAIDARIASQLGELENKIMEVSPVKNIRKENLTVENNS